MDPMSVFSYGRPVPAVLEMAHEFEHRYPSPQYTVSSCEERRTTKRQVGLLAFEHVHADEDMLPLNLPQAALP